MTMEDDIVQEILKLEEEMSIDDTPSTSQSSTISPVVFSSQPNICVPGTFSNLGLDTEKPSNSCPPGVPRGTSAASGNSPQVAAFLKDRRRREIHNFFERKRRSNINDRVKELAALLPRRNEPYFEVFRDSRCNTGQILKASADYIRRLKMDVNRSKKMEAERRTLTQENQQLHKRVEALEARLLIRDGDIEVTVTHPDSATSSRQVKDDTTGS
ncbi:transcription factor E3-like [Homarus americanus]|uniref:Transcription factor E3-like 2 n=1 Tax=Homarus americanus TaxID=6706 RepID=A0A8J5JM74_HOMAM|nr:transcription factor E3-like [Homarus americanus]KAG7158636.1 Transcription factor E3-like 2 [Homarus americanus]